MEEPNILKHSQNKSEPSISAIKREATVVGQRRLSYCWRLGLTLSLGIITTMILLSLISTYPNYTSHCVSHCTATCNNSEEFQANLYKLTEKVHNILDKQSLRHFLCYDALWGAIEVRGVLPWMNKVELCMEREHLATKSMKLWIKDFSDANLTMRYCWRKGVYVITDPDFEGGSVHLILFKEDSKTRNLMRSGWNYFRWTPDCRDKSLHCFHPYLVDKPPLRKKLFGETKMPVPHFNEVIQKQLYPDTWKEGSKGSMPKNC